MKRGRKVAFHGAFGSKKEARAKERRTPHAYIRKKRFKKRGVRYMVLTRR
jgi:hypothetical protein